MKVTEFDVCPAHVPRTAMFVPVPAGAVNVHDVCEQVSVVTAPPLTVIDMNVPLHKFEPNEDPEMTTEPPLVGILVDEVEISGGL